MNPWKLNPMVLRGLVRIATIRPQIFKIREVRSQGVCAWERLR